MPTLAITKLGRYYSTTMPREVRRILGLGSGDGIEWILDDAGIIVRRSGGMVRCHFCGYEAPVEGLRLMREPRRYSFYEVRSLECPKCGGVFFYYYGVSPRGRVSTFTIRKKTGEKPRPKSTRRS